MLDENDMVDVALTNEVTMADDRVEDIEGETNEQLGPETIVKLETPETIEESAVETAPATAAAPQVEAKAADKPEQTVKRDKREQRRLAADMAQVVSWFAACGRCSFFLAGYKVAGGRDAVETAVAQRGKHWLTLSWTQSVANLVHKSYGSRVDIECYHYEGCCSECQRHFVYQAAGGENGSPSLRIELKTRRRE